MKALFQRLKGYFQEGSLESLTRLLAFSCVFAGITVAFIEVIACIIGRFFDVDIEIHSVLIGELIGFGLGAKVSQKIFGEKKPQKTS